MRTICLAALALPLVSAPRDLATTQGSSQPTPLPVLVAWETTIQDQLIAEASHLRRRMGLYSEAAGYELSTFAENSTKGYQMAFFFRFPNLDAALGFQGGTDEGWNGLEELFLETIDGKRSRASILMPVAGRLPAKPLRGRWLRRVRVRPNRRLSACRSARAVVERLNALFPSAPASAFTAELNDPDALYLFIDFDRLADGEQPEQGGASWEQVRAGMLADEKLGELMDALAEQLQDGAHEVVLSRTYP